MIDLCHFFVFIDMVKKKACVISGGGSWGAFGGGTVARINGDYDLVVGVSTGSLLAPLTALKKWEYLKAAYTEVDNTDVFDKCWYKGKPFTKKGKIKKFPVLMTLLLGDKSVCTSNALRKTITEHFPESFFNELRDLNKEVLVGTQNYAQIPSKVHYFSSMNGDYEEFKDWMWCSANFPFFTSLVKKSWKDPQGNFHIGQWSDGGLTDLIGLNQLNGKGFKEVDIILQRTMESDKFEGDVIHTLTENVTKSIRAMRYDIEFEYFYEKVRKLNREGTKVTIYWLPRKLEMNSMVFNKELMGKWWNEGYETAFDSQRIQVFEPIKKRI